MSDLTYDVSLAYFYRDLQDKQLAWEFNQQPCWQSYEQRTCFFFFFRDGVRAGKEVIQSYRDWSHDYVYICMCVCVFM